MVTFRVGVGDQSKTLCARGSGLRSGVQGDTGGYRAGACWRPLHSAAGRLTAWHSCATYLLRAIGSC